MCTESLPFNLVKLFQSLSSHNEEYDGHFSTVGAECIGDTGKLEMPRWKITDSDGTQKCLFCQMALLDEDYAIQHFYRIYELYIENLKHPGEVYSDWEIKLQLYYDTNALYSVDVKPAKKH